MIDIINNEIYFYVDLIDTLTFFSHQTLLHIAPKIVIFSSLFSTHYCLLSVRYV